MLRDDRLEEHRWRRLETRLVSATAEEVPAWTGQPGDDPGITFVELFAFLAEQLLFRANAIPERSRRRIIEIGERLASISGDDGESDVDVYVGGEKWSEVAALDAAGPSDAVFTVTSEGRVVFGDGVHGRNPAGSTVSASYRLGAGSARRVRVAVTSRWRPPQSRYSVMVDAQDGVRVTRIDESVG